jgi:hypothetical protein
MSTEEIVDWIVARGKATQEQLHALLALIRQKMAHAALHGEVLDIPGLGAITPKEGGDASGEMLFEPDPELIEKLNAPGAPKPPMINQENVGLTEDELVEKRNQLHPEDPVED